MIIFASFFLYLGFDIQENTLTFRLRRNLGVTSEMLKQVWHFTRFALNLPFQNGGTRQKAKNRILIIEELTKNNKHEKFSRYFS